MNEQVIPESFGRLRRWWYTRHPLRDVCRITKWRHRWTLSEGGWGDGHCPCGAKCYVDYGR